MLHFNKYNLYIFSLFFRSTGIHVSHTWVSVHSTVNDFHRVWKFFPGLDYKCTAENVYFSEIKKRVHGICQDNTFECG